MVKIVVNSTFYAILAISVVPVLIFDNIDSSVQLVSLLPLLFSFIVLLLTVCEIRTFVKKVLSLGIVDEDGHILTYKERER